MGIRDNKQTYNKYMREYHLKRYYRLKSEAHASLGGKCINCESTDDLQMDHIDRHNKSFSASKMLSFSLKAFWEEIKKCQLLCKKCHRVKTTIESGKRMAKGNHGTLSCYRYCKCNLCKKAKADWSREYMKKYRQKEKLLK